MGPPPGGDDDVRAARTWLFDFENPSSYTVGLNEFTAPAGAFAYQRIQYFIVLSDFGSSLSIKETTSDNEDADGETGAILFNSVGENSSVLRLAVKGSKRARGILVSTYAQDGGDQEIVSAGDDSALKFTVGAAGRYLIRGVTFSIDNSTSTGGGFTNPWDLRLGTSTLVRIVSTRQIPGINEFTAPQGATVAGGTEYKLSQDILSVTRAGGVVLSRHHCSPSTEVDSPSAAGVIIGGVAENTFACSKQPLMAVFGEPLVAMVQNLGQTGNSYFTVGDTYKVVSQGFTTGSDAFGYRLQGIGVAIEGSDDTDGNAQVPSGPTSVSVAVHADSGGGEPGAKLFDLVSPGEFAAGHSFFEAPPGTNLAPNTSYVMVWSYLRGTWHRLQRTSSNGEDSGARTGASIADGLNRGADLASLSAGTNKLEIAVYTEVSKRAPFVAGGIEVTQSWLHIPEGVDAGYQFRALFVTHRGRLPTSGDIDDYNTWGPGGGSGDPCPGRRSRRSIHRSGHLEKTPRSSGRWSAPLTTTRGPTPR